MKGPLQAFQFMGGTKLRYEAANWPYPGLLYPRIMGPACCTWPVQVRYEIWVDGKLALQGQCGVRPRQSALSSI